MGRQPGRRSSGLVLGQSPRHWRTNPAGGSTYQQHTITFFEQLESRLLLDALTIDASQVTNSIAYPFLGVNYVEFWDPIQGSMATQNALKNAGVQVIRFPGGAPGDWYQWDKPATWSVSNNGNDTSPLRLQAYAAAVGAKVMFQTNSTTNVQNGIANDPSGTHTAAWVNYMNANNAYVPYWEIGNEQDMESIKSPWPDYDWTNYQWYINRFNEQAAAMKAADPTIKVLGNVGTNTWYWSSMHSLDMFLAKTGNRAGTGLDDGVSVHWYGGSDSAASWSSVESFAQGWNTSYNWQYIRDTIAKNDTRNLPVFITEGNASDGAQGTGAVMSTQLASALANGDMVGALRDSGVQSFEWFGDLHGVYSPTYGGWGIFYGQGDSGTADTPSPKYWMLPIWSHAGNEVLKITSGITDASTTLSAYASRSTNGNIQVTLINKTAAARTIDLNVNNFAIAGRNVNIYELKGASGGIADTSVIYNGVTNPVATSTAPLPAPLNGGTVSGSTYSRTVPGYSMTMIEFVVNNANQAPVARISSPANTGNFENNAAIVVSADAFDNDGSVAKVDFYRGTTLIGTATSGTNRTWAINWSGMAAGGYTITAKATDNLGATTTSAPVTITVVNRGGAPVAVPGIIQAESYNSGGQYVAYRDFDNTTPQTATGGGATYLTTIRNIEWEKYSISVATAGTYSITARVANAGTGGKFHINIDGINVTGSMTVPYTGGAITWYTVGKNGISLSAGTHTMQFVVDSSNPATAGTLGNIDYFQIQTAPFTEVTPAAPTVSGAAGSQLTNLSWGAIVGATSYNIYRGLSPTTLTLYQTNYTSLAFSDNGLTNGTTYYYQVSAVTQSGVEGTRSAIVGLTPAAAVAVTLPWQAGDIGGPTLAGSGTFGGGAFTVRGSGGDVQGTADQLQFVYRQITGDVTITAQIISQTNTNEWAKAGLMIRQSLDPGAVNAFTRITPSHNAGFQFRAAAGGASTDNVLGNPAATPYWLRLVRSGANFSGYISPDGTTWTQIGATQTLTMTGNVYVGLAVCSHDNTKLSAATLINVSVTSTSLPATPTLTATAVSNSQINLSWTNVTGETGYELDRSADGTNWTPLTTTAADVATYSNSGLTPNTTYYYRVRAYVGTSPSQIRSDNSPTASALTNVTNQAPTVATAAAAVLNASNTSAALTALGADDGGEPALSYIWSYTGPAGVTFSANSTHAAKNSTATFAALGSYTFTVTIRDAQGLTVTSNVSRTVVQIPTTVVTSPSGVTVVAGATQNYTAAVKDQFANAMATTPSWTATGGTIGSSSGLFTAGSTGGNFTVTATAGTASNGVSVTVFPTAFNGTSGNDTFTCSLSSDGKTLQVWAGATLYTVSKSAVTSLTFTPGLGDDTLTLDGTYGNPMAAYGLSFDGGAGNNTVNFNGGVYYLTNAFFDVPGNLIVKIAANTTVTVGDPPAGLMVAPVSLNGMAAMFAMEATPAPTLTLSRAGAPLQSGQSVNLGSVPLAENAAAQTFTLTNTGTIAADLGALTIPAGFVLLQAPATHLEPGASTALSLALNTTTLGTHSGTLSLPVTNSTPITLALKGTITNPIGKGLLGHYYATQTLRSLRLTRVDPAISFDWNKGTPLASLGRDHFSIAWTGQVLPLVGGTYTFYTRTNDGVRLWVDGQLLINRWSNSANGRQDHGAIALNGGVKHTIVLEYVENTGAASVDLTWSSPTMPRQHIAPTQLFAVNLPLPALPGARVASLVAAATGMTPTTTGAGQAIVILGTPALVTPTPTRINHAPDASSSPSPQAGTAKPRKDHDGDDGTLSQGWFGA